VDRKAVDAWCLYDWANSAFATTVMAALFPPFYRSLCLRAGLDAGEATAAYGYLTAGALLVAALAGPVIGAIADHAGLRKRGTLAFAGLGIAATAAFVTIGPAAWPLATALFVVANLGFAGSIVFYESLLPAVAPPGELDRVSSRGYALGYVGGGLLLALNVLWLVRPAAFGLADSGAAVKASFVSVALWWGAFSWPLLRRVPEPPGAGLPAGMGGRPGASGWGAAVRGGLARLRQTLREARRHRQLSLFLLAFWVYNDGIGTIIKMATAYGDEIGITVADMSAALVITQFVGFPCTLLFGRLAGRAGAKAAVLLALGVYTLIAAAGFFMTRAWHFYALAALVGAVQGGAQALSRSLFAAMVPRTREAEFFGFFSTSAKFAGIAGPLVFGLVSQLAGGSRLSILSLIVFFVAGASLLARVDVEAGRREAAGGW